MLSSDDIDGKIKGSSGGAVDLILTGIYLVLFIIIVSSTIF